MGAPPWVLEQERQCWLLRGSALCEVVAGTNFVGAARTRSICVGGHHRRRNRKLDRCDPRSEERRFCSEAAEDAAVEEESKCLAAEAAGEGGKSYEGASAGYVV